MASRNSGQTGKAAAKQASKTLRSPDTSAKSRSAAGSALSQRSTTKKTSPAAATEASATLRDGRTAKASKGAAGSALAQTPAGRKR